MLCKCLFVKIQKKYHLLEMAWPKGLLEHVAFVLWFERRGMTGETSGLWDNLSAGRPGNWPLSPWVCIWFDFAMHVVYTMDN